MEGETERGHQSWRIRVTAKAKHFNFRFRFKAATHSSTHTLSFFRFSILLNLPHFLFTISSRPQKQPRPSFITSKFNNFFRKFRPRIKPNIAVKTKTSSNLSLPMRLQHTVRIGKEYCVRIVMMVASVVCFVASLLLKKFKMEKELTRSWPLERFLKDEVKRTNLIGKVKYFW
ncbi:unnamed protein product [Vicia faba]|uniref:Transmembrane protein n=1 Tax=Vicia faba TaxID=3906 RepID=A0AAV1AUX0_VICFA|nr:unnamed protein product [Vicia faba]